MLVWAMQVPKRMLINKSVVFALFEKGPTVVAWSPQGRHAVAPRVGRRTPAGSTHGRRAVAKFDLLEQIVQTN